MESTSRLLSLAASRPVLGLIRRTVILVACSGTLAGAACAATFYVNNQNPAANDAGPGTLAEPYRTISAAVTQRGGPGTTIEVLPGIYREHVSASASGAAGNPFVIRASGPGVVVEGAESFASAAQWTQLSGNVWRASGVTWLTEQVFADGQRLTPSTAMPALLPARSFVYVAGEGLYANVGGGNPGTHGTLVGRYAYGFTIPNRSWVTIEGFEIRRSDTKGIFASGASASCVLRGNSISLARLSGIHLSGGSAYTLAANQTFENGDHGIFLSGGVTASLVHDNDSYRNARLAVRAANGIHLFGAPGNRLERNRAHENQDSGIAFRSGSNDNISIQNRSWNNGDHGFDHLGSSNVSHIHDVSHGNLNDGFSFEAASLNPRVYNCISTNNGITTNGSNLFVDATSLAAYASDYNLFWNENATPPVRIGATSYVTVAAYSAATGRDAHSVQADPRFVNAAGGDLHILPTSPAIDAATSAVANWPALDADGRARFDVPAVSNAGAGPVSFADIGAFEFVDGAGNLPPIAALVAEPASGTAPLVVTLNAAGSRDPGGSIVSYAFDFGDGSSLAPQPSPTVVHIYSAGTWTARVTVRDNGGLTSSASARVEVSSAGDRAPVISAPAQVKVNEKHKLKIRITAYDPDGDKIRSLTADLSELPAGHNAKFKVNKDRTEATLEWKPTRSDAGRYRVTFRAANTLVGSAVTVIHVVDKSKGKDRIDDQGGDVLSQHGAGVPLQAALELSSAWPNPASGPVDFALDLPRSSRVQWAIYDVQGRAVWAEDRGLAAGRAMLRWPGTTGRGERTAKGLYLVRVRVEGAEFIRRVVRL